MSLDQEQTPEEIAAAIADAANDGPTAQELVVAIETYRAAEAAALQANIERKNARNRIAVLLQELGLTGFSIGPGQ